MTTADFAGEAETVGPTTPKTSPSQKLSGLAPVGVEAQPLSSLSWVPASRLRSNSWNPNHVAPAEMRLLKVSLLENGWTQPIVAHPDGEIVDGFHRWTLASTDRQVGDLTRQDGEPWVPVVHTFHTDPALARLATVRHNRARGSHAVLKMADIVAWLSDAGMDVDEVARRLGMEDEEVDRLLDRGNMLKRGAADDFGKGWIPGYEDQTAEGDDG